MKVPVAQDILDGYAAEAAGAHRIEPRCRVRRQRLVQRGEQRPALGAEAGGAGEEVLSRESRFRDTGGSERTLGAEKRLGEPLYTHVGATRRRESQQQPSRCPSRHRRAAGADSTGNNPNFEIGKRFVITKSISKVRLFASHESWFRLARL